MAVPILAVLVSMFMKRMKTAVTSEHTPGDQVSTWSYVELAEHLCRTTEGIITSVSKMWRILTSTQIRFDRVRSWFTSRDDPEFWNRVRDVIGPYRNSPGENARF